MDSPGATRSPATSPERPDDAAQPELEQRLRGLALPPYVGRHRPDRREDWTAARFPTAPGVAFTSVAVLEAEQLEVTLGEPANTLIFPVVADRWLTSSRATRAATSHPSRRPVTGWTTTRSAWRWSS